MTYLSITCPTTHLCTCTSSHIAPSTSTCHTGWVRCIACLDMSLDLSRYLDKSVVNQSLCSTTHTCTSTNVVVLLVCAVQQSHEHFACIYRCIFSCAFLWLLFKRHSFLLQVCRMVGIWTTCSVTRSTTKHWATSLASCLSSSSGRSSTATSATSCSRCGSTSPNTGER